jgi:hypothetical protein
MSKPNRENRYRDEHSSEHATTGAPPRGELQQHYDGPDDDVEITAVPTLTKKRVRALLGGDLMGADMEDQVLERLDTMALPDDQKDQLFAAWRAVTRRQPEVTARELSRTLSESRY